MHKVLIIDDQKEYVQSQIELASHFGIDLQHIDNWEDAQQKLEQDLDFFKAVIIDGKGKLNKKGKGEDVKQLTRALKWLGEQNGKGNHIHYVVNTGFSEDINTIIENEKVYGKLGEEKKMFEDIIVAIHSTTPQKIRVKYSDVFEIFKSGILSAGVEKILIGVLSQFENPKVDKGDFNKVRDVLEDNYKKLNEKGYLPNEMIINSKVNLEWSNGYLAGLEVDVRDKYNTIIKSYYQNNHLAFRAHISRHVEGKKQVTSILSHDYDKTFTKYSVMNVTYGIMEVLIWTKEICK